MTDHWVLTIGNFDGVHVGHRAILARARQQADSQDAQVLALTFDPHPSSVLRPGQEPPRLSGVSRRLADLKMAGADYAERLEPTRQFLSQSPEQFIQRIVTRYQPLALVEGADFRFGRDRAGDMVRLCELGQQLGFKVVEVPSVEVLLGDQTQVEVSSSLVRWLIGHGRVCDAARCLRQSYSITGKVAYGAQRGRRIGFPTVNLDPADYHGQIVPADGVYAGVVQVPAGTGGQGGTPVVSQIAAHGDESRIGVAESKGLNCGIEVCSYRAAISVGVKPTFGQKNLTIEAHLLDFKPQSDELYGQTLTLFFEQWLRDQYPFPNVAALQEQLRRDVARIRNWPQQAADHQTQHQGATSIARG